MKGNSTTETWTYLIIPLLCLIHHKFINYLQFHQMLHFVFMKYELLMGSFPYSYYSASKIPFSIIFIKC